MIMIWCINLRGRGKKTWEWDRKWEAIVVLFNRNAMLVFRVVDVKMMWSSSELFGKQETRACQVKEQLAIERITL